MSKYNDLLDMVRDLIDGVRDISVEEIKEKAYRLYKDNIKSVRPCSKHIG